MLCALVAFALAPRPEDAGVRGRAWWQVGRPGYPDAVMIVLAAPGASGIAVAVDEPIPNFGLLTTRRAFVGLAAPDPRASKMAVVRVHGERLDGAARTPFALVLPMPPSARATPVRPFEVGMSFDVDPRTLEPRPLRG